MKIYYITIICYSLLISCKRDRNNEVTPSPIKLLTQKTWILTGIGFDDNKNGVLDEFENMIQNCQRDNSYVFNAQGTGAYFDNGNTCGNEVVGDFNWKFLNNYNILEIDFEKLHVLKLSAIEMVLQPQSDGFIEPYLITYTH
jgi:Lipocalin-like domain